MPRYSCTVVHGYMESVKQHRIYTLTVSSVRLGHSFYEASQRKVNLAEEA